MGKIYYLMGKSASGKDTIYRELLKKCPRLRRVVLYTTRPMRDGECEGREYYFANPKTLEAFEKQGKIIEMRTYQTVCGPWSYAPVDDGRICLEEADYLAIGTLESYEKLREYYGEDVVKPLYVTVDDGVRLERALAREKTQKKPNYAELCRRFLADEEDFAQEKLERLGIQSSFVNETLDKCVDEILSAIQNG